VIIDGPDWEMPGWVLARSSGDAAEIDPVVRIKAGRSKAAKALEPGEFALVDVTGSDGYDLVAKLAKAT